MLTSLKVFNYKGNLIKISYGDILKFNKFTHGIAPEGAEAEVFMWHPATEEYIGLRAINPEYIDGWSDLDGEVDEETGMWFSIAHLMEITNLSQKIIADMVVAKSHKFKQKDLYGKECRILDYIDGTRLVFVEFDEDVSGCSADGLGKRGHCIAVPKNILKPVKDTEIKEKKVYAQS